MTVFNCLAASAFVLLICLAVSISADKDKYEWTLFKETTFSNLKNSDTLSNQDHTCQLQVQSESFSNKENEILNAYAGNAFSYELGCHINDPLMKVGDKYYIIDLIVYGPNSRVAKAWREQFSISSLLKTRNMFMNKKISFRFLGLNKVVCSVTKYNNLLNQFSRLCEKTTAVNASENMSVQLKSDNENKLSLISSYKSSLMKYMMPSKAYLLRQKDWLKNGTKLERQLLDKANISNVWPDFYKNRQINEDKKYTNLNILIIISSLYFVLVTDSTV